AAQPAAAQPAAAQPVAASVPVEQFGTDADADGQPHDMFDNLFESEAVVDTAVPPPAYRPAPQPPRAPAPRPAAAAVPAQIDADASGFVAPQRRPAGSPSPEALERLRAAVGKAPAPRMQAPAAPRAPQPQPRAEEPRGRFGLGSLINRMAGHSPTPLSDTPSERLAARPASQAPGAEADYDDANHDNDRIEIPAFLRRQAN
ncbi:MAG: cell division protein FtsZ, partial [Gemmobacter sp.]